MQRNGGQLLIDVLDHAGIDTVFTLHGGHLDAIFQAALDRGIRLIDTRHEQAAGHAADGWARTTGEIGVAIVTAGPGFTDAVTAIANAYLDAVPTLFIAGAAPLRDAETLPLQGGIDQVAMVAPITKWAHQITHTHRIPDLVARALHIARSGRPGPVFLEIPIDILFGSADAGISDAIGLATTPVPPAPPPEAVTTALDWLADAERPAIMAGGGAWFSGAGPELREFAELINAPVFANSKARGLLPDDHPLAAGSFTNLAIGAMTGDSPDLIVLLGARLGLFTGGRAGSTLPADAKVIHIDIEAEELGRNRDVELGIAADCRESLRAFLAAGRDRAWPERSAWCDQGAAIRNGGSLLFADALAASSAPIHPYRLMAELAEALPHDVIIAADGGETSGWMEMTARIHHGGHWMSHGYLGCLGTGMPFAIAAKVAHPDRPVVCVIGDGSVGLNFAEFDTMVRHQLPIVVVINNDQLWGMSAHGQDLIFGRDRRVVTELGPVRYDLAAAGFGCHAELVTEPSEIGPAVQRALDSGRPACINVMTDPEVISPVTMALVGRLGGDDGNGDGENSGTVIPYYENLDE